MQASLAPAPQKQPGFFSKTFRIIAIGVAGFMVFATALAMRKISAPGAPVAWAYAALAVAIVTCALQFPAAFYRLPGRGRLLATALLVVTFVLAIVADQQMRPAWSKTAAGMREAAEDAERERQAAAVQAREAARLEEERKTTAALEAEQKQAQLAANQIAQCRALEADVIAMSEKGMFAIIEINDIQFESAADDGKTLKCTGKAVMSRGDDRTVDFGLSTTPQGKTLVNMNLG